MGIRRLFLGGLFSCHLVFGYNLYYGNLHSHTSYSDGQSIPRHAFAYARDTARIQVLAITDHGEMLSAAEWEDTKIQADSATRPDIFLGLAGFEWSSPILGHLNVLNTIDYTNCLQNPTMRLIYQWLALREGAIGQFNHPTPQNYNSFAYDPIGDLSLTLFEIQNRDQARRFHIALDSGWRVGIAANQDNHTANWGLGNQLTGIWAESLTLSSIISALQNMRTFGTLDRNFQLSFKANNQWMGSVIPNGEIEFEIWAFDPDLSERIKRINLITNNNRIVDSLICDTNEITWQTRTNTSPNDKCYFFVLVIEQDNDYIVSSPVWTEGGVAIRDRQDRFALTSDKISPNPFTSTITFTFSPGEIKDLKEIKIYSSTGRAIKSFSPPPTAGSISWDGKDGRGREIPVGAYFLILDRGSDKRVKKLLRLSPN